MSDGDSEARLSAAVRQRWDGGAVLDFTLEAHQPLNGWSLVVEAGGTIVNIWNARILAQEGTRYTLGAADYNGKVAAGAAVEFGLQVEGAANLFIVSADVTPAAAAAGNEDGALPPLATPPPAAADGAFAAAPPVPPPLPAAGAPPAATDAPGGAAIPAPPAATDVPGGAAVSVPHADTVPPAPGGGAATLPPGPATAGPPPLPALRERLTAQDARVAEADGGALSVGAPTAPEPAGSRAGLPADAFAPGPFATRGADIVDAAGTVAPIRGLNWFGFETETSAPHGLWARNWREMMDEVKDLGFNTLRLPFSGDLVRTGGVVSGVDYGLNPDLAGLDGLQVMDAVVRYAGEIGLRVILDYHRGTPGGGPNESGLWYGGGRTEGDVLAEWRMMADRYRDAPAVVGADLVNEPHLGTWGDGSPSDWAAAAGRIGDAVLSRAPHWLVIVEGVSVHNGDSYWWGGNLQGVKDHPVRLSMPDRLVYSAHDYPASVSDQPWFTDGSALEEVWRKNWGYLVEDGIAPVLLGEWGSMLATAADQSWAHALRAYLDKTGIPWMWWALNPNSGDTGGLFGDDWTTVRPAVAALLGPDLAATRPEIGFADAGERFASTLFTVTLDAPATDDTVLKFATTDGTATAGRDYVATAGTLTFAPGEQSKSVAVPLLPDGIGEGDEFFYLVLGGGGAQRASGTAVIVDGERDRRHTALPSVDVASAVVSEPAAGARFRIVLSEPTDHDVTVNFRTRADTAGAADFKPADGSLVIPAGRTEATLEIPVADDPQPEADERFTLELTAADGAAIRTGTATGVIAATPPGQLELAVGVGPTAQTQLTIDLILEDDWGSGALFNVILKNVSDAPISGWELALNLPFDIAEVWSAHLVADDGDRVTLENAEWNGSIAPGETINFGFIASVGGIVLGSVLAAADLTLAVE